jgi:hypothetical protein
VKNPFSYGAVLLFVFAAGFVVWASVLPSAAGGLLAAALACAVVGGLMWMMANRLGVFVYRGGKVLKKGIRAEGRVNGVLDEADVELNGNSILELELEVSQPNKDPFTTSVRQMIPKGKVDLVRTKGTTLPVRIDIRDRLRVVIDFDHL